MISEAAPPSARDTLPDVPAYSPRAINQRTVSATARRPCAAVTASLRRRRRPARSGNSRASPSREAGATPRSVMMPVTRRAGVTSKPGLCAALPAGVTRTRAPSPAAVAPATVVTSSGDALLDRDVRRSPAPSIVQSIEGEGAAT